MTSFTPTSTPRSTPAVPAAGAPPASSSFARPSTAAASKLRNAITSSSTSPARARAAAATSETVRSPLTTARTASTADRSPGPARRRSAAITAARPSASPPGEAAEDGVDRVVDGAVGDDDGGLGPFRVDGDGADLEGEQLLGAVRAGGRADRPLDVEALSELTLEVAGHGEERLDLLVAERPEVAPRLLDLVLGDGVVVAGEAVLVLLRAHHAGVDLPGDLVHLEQVRCHLAADDGLAEPVAGLDHDERAVARAGVVGEHHAGAAGVDQLLDDDGDAVVLALDLPLGPVGADVRLEGREEAPLHLGHHLGRPGGAEEGAELPGAARLGRVLDRGARAHGHRELGHPAGVAEREVGGLDVGPQGLGHGAGRAGRAGRPGGVVTDARDVVEVGRGRHDERARHLLAGSDEAAEADRLAPDDRQVLGGTVAGRHDVAGRKGRREGHRRCRRHRRGLGARHAGAPARSRMVTTPWSPSTRMRSPVFTSCVPTPVATTAGSSYSRETMAACDMIPPPSETAAAMRAKTIDQLGAVSGQTRISPSTSSDSSSTRCTTRATPSAVPGEAARPRNSPDSPPSVPADSHRSTVSELMPNRVTVIGSVMRSGGTPRAGGGLQASSAL